MIKPVTCSAVPRIALTPGEPAGIGPDLLVQLQAENVNAEIVVFADGALLTARAQLLGRQFYYKPWPVTTAPQAGTWRLQAVPLAMPVQPRHLDPRNAEYVLATLEAACTACLTGHCAALVTGPVHKGVINQAGYSFSGHTEWLAEHCGGQPVMLLAAPGLRVALVTTHLPLAAVSAAITASRLERVARTLYTELQTRFGIIRPRILVCGLNPHAGEGGYLGQEEITIISPVLERLRAAGLNFIGPLPADSLFTPTSLAQADAVLAMYHDQGLPVLKHLGFGRAVNITLGLPIIRTSVDHGTALDLAGSARANPSSLRAALDLAITLAGTAAHSESVLHR